ncbi:hypothetical protein FHS85_000611 [Rhodoligotrophos appendicifer]|uniref:hypothetical protein n=1 Tax=Rhodoligotrophos appendicifer TaxID=987056 RepID=UPI00117E0A50|nr:hypothetical protein [Rhodoligotrophos appendicifer]
MTRRSKLLTSCVALIALGASALVTTAQADENCGGERWGKRWEEGKRWEQRKWDRFRHGDSGPRGDRGHRGPHHGGPHPGGFVKMIMERYDTDDDGRIKVEEMITIRTDEMKKFDKNVDGKLDLAEYEALWLDRMRERMVRSFQRYDRDGDALVTIEEYNKFATDMAKRLDRNKDGVIERMDRRGGRAGTRGNDRCESGPAKMNDRASPNDDRASPRDSDQTSGDSDDDTGGSED